MRLRIGDTTGEEVLSQPPEDWRGIKSPALRVGYFLAALAGIALFIGLCVGLGAWSWLAGERGGISTAGDSENSWIPVLVVLVLFIPLHEFVHLLTQPEWGMSDRSVLALWPARLRFGVYYEGCMSRRRWLVMRLAPLVVLSVLPACILAMLHFFPLSIDLDIGLQVMMILNALGSGGDILAVIIVLSQVPPTARMCFHAGAAYWQPN